MGQNLQGFDQKKVATLSPTTDSLTCPVRAVCDVMVAVPDLLPSAPLLVFKDKTTPMPTSYIWAEWARTLNHIGEDHTLYSLHSLRKASATLAHSGGCTVLEVQRHGGWSSTGYKTYIQTDSTNVLSQSLN